MNGLWILAYERLFQDFDYDTYWFWYRIGIKLLKALLYFFIPDLGMYSLTCLAVLPVAFGRRDCCCLSGSKDLTEHWRETVSSKLIRKLKYFMNSTYLSQETRKLIHVEWFHTLHYVCVVRYFQSACHYHHRCLLRFGPSSQNTIPRRAHSGKHINDTRRIWNMHDFVSQLHLEKQREIKTCNHREMCRDKVKL